MMGFKGLAKTGDAAQITVLENNDGI